MANGGREKQMKVAITFAAVLILATTNWADELPRKAKTPRESYPNVDVIYDSIITPHGERLRTIITKPHDAKGKLPVIFVAGWLSCDSVEAPPAKDPGPGVVRHDATGVAFRSLAQLPGFCLFRVDKQGVGDSEGNCAENDFESELAGYRAAFHALKNYDFIDSNQIYMLGISNGGGFAPLVPETDVEQRQVRGYIVVGGWVKTWFEHMLEIERRRFALMGKSPGEVNDRMKSAATLYRDWLIKNKTVDQILQENSELADLWPEGKDHAHLYGRPLAFYQQLQKLNLAAAWGRVKVPTLVLHGQFDWIMSREDHELIAEYVNANRPGAARFVEVPEMGHTFQHYLSFADAFHGKEAEFNPKVVQLLIDWLKQQPTNNIINSQPGSASTAKHTLELGDFTNRTDEKIFNGILKQALRTALDESPFFDLEADGLLAQSSDESRQHSADEVFVAASIKKRATHFVIELKATNGVAGETLAEEHVEAADQRNVLNALGQAAQSLRIQLGEPADSARQFGTPLERATSASLEALQAWSFGVEAKQLKGPAAAIPFFQKAIELDPNFASALFDLGLIYRNSQQEALARNLFNKAFATRGRASARKRFSIEGLYYSFVTVEYDRAVETYHQWMRIYPRDERPVSNLGSFYGDVCEYEQAIAQFKEARRMNPRNFIVHEDLIEILTAAGEFEKAREAYSEMLRMNLDDDAPHVYMYAVAFLEHDAKEMAGQAAWFTAKPDVQHEILSEQADAEAYQGHLARARELTTQAVQSALTAHNKEQAAAWLLNASWREVLFGHTREAHDQAVRAMELAPDSREGGAIAAILLARTGDEARATTIAAELEKRFPQHVVVQSYWLRCIRAQIALTKKNPTHALQLLQTAAHYDALLPQVAYYSHMPSVVLRAEAYSATGKPVLAAKEWQTILKTPGIVQLSASAPFAILQLARIYASQGGEYRDQSRAAYEHFLSLWKDADPEVSALKEAKSEYADPQGKHSRTPKDRHCASANPGTS